MSTNSESEQAIAETPSIIMFTQDEASYRDAWASTLNGRTEVRLTTGRADIVTDTYVWEVKTIMEWKVAIGQALVYAEELGLTPGIALFGELPIASLTTRILEIAEKLGMGVLLNVWTPLNGVPRASCYTGEYICSVCGRAFSTANGINAHRRWCPAKEHPNDE